MKTARIFILIGARTIVLCAGLSFAEAQFSPALSGELPIVRYDPRAGDPDEPQPGYSLPLDDWDSITNGSEKSLSATPGVRSARPGVHPFWLWLMNQAWFGTSLSPKGR